MKTISVNVIGYFFCVYFLLGEASLVIASELSLFGNGARNTAMGNATVSFPTDAFSQNYNPALMPWEGKLFSFGVQGAITNFEPIHQVIVDTPSLNGSQFTTADVNTKTADTFLMTLAFQTPLAASPNALYFGMYLSTPVERLLAVDTQDSFQPQYSLYLNDTQRFTPGFNFAMKLNDNLSLGLGGEIYFAQGSTALLRQPVGGISTGRLKSEIKPLFSPRAGVEGVLGESFKLGAAYRGKEDYSSAISVQDLVGLIGQTPLNFVAQSSWFYEPETLSAGGSYTDKKTTLVLSADWQRWTGFSGTTEYLNYSTFTNSFSQALPPTPYHDVIVAHAGFEKRFEVYSLRAGYTFMPTPVPDQSGESNILDTDRHVVTLGCGTQFRWSAVDALLKFDIGGLAQFLNPKQVVKNSSQSIGYPGYKIGGTVYGYATTLTAEF